MAQERQSPLVDPGSMIAASKEIRISSYERVSSLLLALLLIVASASLALFLIWLTKQVGTPPYVMVEVEAMGFAGRGDHEAGLARDAKALAGEISDTPGLEEEMEEIIEPQITSSLEEVTKVVSNEALAFDSMELLVGSTNIGRGTGLGGTGEGLGDSRPPGPLGERLELRFVTTSKTAYARQLDRLGIELGIIGGGEAQVDYAFNLAKPKPDRRAGPGHKEKRVYFSHAGKADKLKEWDLEFCDAAEIRTKGRYVMQFVPPALQNQMLQLEAQKMGKRRIQEINKTVFGIRESGGNPELYVIEQTYRAAPRS